MFLFRRVAKFRYVLRSECLFSAVSEEAEEIGFGELQFVLSDSKWGKL